MTGLDKILKHIEDAAAMNEESMLNQGKREADKIIADAMAEGKQRCAEIRKETDRNVKASMSRAESAAALQEKKLILNAKQQIISDVILSAKEYLLNLSDEKYFENILLMVKKYALPKAGGILFSEKDYKRLPEQFEDIINVSLTDKKEAVLKISQETRNIDGGFVLTYGEVEVNCSFEGLFSADIENLQDKVSELLFA